MSEFSTNIDDENAICPYCKEEHYIDHEDFLDEDEESIINCDGCGKKFHHYTCYMIDQRTKPDCEINGDNHQYKTKELSTGENHGFCVVCGKCEPVKNWSR